MSEFEDDHQIDIPEENTSSIESITDTEARLMAQGVFTYTPEDRAADESKQKPMVDYPRRYSMDGELGKEVDTYERMWEIAWKEKFSGQMPASWVNPDDARSSLFDFNRAHERPSANLLEAALNHPDGWVASLAVGLFGVTYDQAVDVLSRDMSEEDRVSIVESLKLGKKDQKALLAQVRAQREAINSPMFRYETQAKERHRTEKRASEKKFYSDGFGILPAPVAKAATRLLGLDPNRRNDGPFRYT